MEGAGLSKDVNFRGSLPAPGFPSYLCDWLRRERTGWKDSSNASLESVSGGLTVTS